MTRQTDDRRYAASVSIRSGRGSHTHDRVLRFQPLFECRDAAARYALDQGLAWLSEHPHHAITTEHAWPRKS